MLDHAMVLEMFTPGKAPVLITERAGQLEVTMVVSERALAVARRKARVTNPDAYAIAFDGVVDDTEPAVIVELAHRGDEVASVTAFRDGVATLLQRRHSMIDFDPLDLRWTRATPDIYGEKLGAVHIIAHRLDSADAVARTLRFLRGRRAFFAEHAPLGTEQRAVIDTAGQDVPAELRAQLDAEAPMPLEWR